MERKGVTLQQETTKEKKLRGRELHYNKKQQKEEVKRNEFTL